MKHEVVVDLMQELRYRRRMDVRKAYFSPSTQSCYPICPACDVPMEREYQNYCDRCGQKLNWGHWRALPVAVEASQKEWQRSASGEQSEAEAGHRNRKVFEKAVLVLPK